jgi:putative flippase GtrA
VSESVQRGPLIKRLTEHIPTAQFRRYILVGIWNTLFGYAVYAGFTAVLTPHVPYAYIVASLLASVLNITGAFLGYKWFIFKTTGNYLREWFRCVLVYSGGITIGIVLLPGVVYAIRHSTRFDASAPYIAGALLTGLNVVVGFLGHKRYSFQVPAASSS